MQAVILAAGRGTRMGNLTGDTPKPLLKIEGRTLLEHNLAALPGEIDEVVLVVGYLGEKIRQAIGESFAGKKIVYVEQKELLGTAHALSLCKDVLRGRFLVFYGDDIYGAEDLAELAKRPLGILTWEMKSDERGADRHALIKISDGKLTDIVERQPAGEGDLVNTGAYMLDGRIFDYPLVSAGVPAGEFGLPQTMLQMVKEGAEFDIVKAKNWRKVASPEDLR